MAKVMEKLFAKKWQERSLSLPTRGYEGDEKGAFLRRLPRDKVGEGRGRG